MHGARLAGAAAALAVLPLLATLGCARATTPPPVECTLEYGGASQRTLVRPTRDPYRVPVIPIEDAFEFKAVYVAAPLDAAALSFYAYYTTDRGPVLAEETKYRPPFPRNAPSLNGNFTGSHHVYGPDGDELVYSCRWRSQ